jgi:hypothetical protein
MTNRLIEPGDLVLRRRGHSDDVWCRGVVLRIVAHPTGEFGEILWDNDTYSVGLCRLNEVEAA